MSAGWDQRLKILRRDAERTILDPLRTHSWTINGVSEYEQGEYLIIEAERGEQRHKVALLYSSGTANGVYKRLASVVEHIFVNGDLYKLASFAYGIDTPVTRVEDFYNVLVEWNASSASGKFAPGDPTSPPPAQRPAHRQLLSENPIEAVWLRLRQLGSVTLARKLVVARGEGEQRPLDEAAIASKATGVAYSVRNAADYFQAYDVRNVSQRVLNLYYGSLSFAFAEMLAAPEGTSALDEIEASTKFGHGLYTIDGASDGLENLVVGIIDKGFFPSWMKTMGLDVGSLPGKKPKAHSDLDHSAPIMWATVEQLFARIPEVSDLFLDIFDGLPGWVAPHYDSAANKPMSISGMRNRPSRSYVELVDESTRLTREAIAELRGPISEIAEIPSEEGGRVFRAAIDHKGEEFWHDALRIHHSPFTQGALIRPLFGAVDEFRPICVALLYALSIVVRYRPSIWRRVQEGDLDHLRVLIEAFLAVVERVLPEQFLETITGQRVFAKQPGSW